MRYRLTELALKKEVNLLAIELKDLRKSMDLLHGGTVDNAPRVIDKHAATKIAATSLTAVKQRLKRSLINFARTMTAYISYHAIRYHLSI